MDLFAYSQIDIVEEYVKKHYGEPPRFRGIRFMKVEEPDDSDCYNADVFNSHIGEDVICIHTRCGSYGDDSDPDSNYVCCGALDWEESNPDTFIESVDDYFDPTYRDHYFKAIDDDEYRAIVRELEEAGRSE